MQSSKFINEGGGLLALTLFASMVIGCDVESDPVQERAIEFDVSATTGETAEVDHADEPREFTPPAAEPVDEDECGFAEHHDPAGVVWVRGEVPSVAVNLDATYGSEDRVTLQFHAGRMGEPRMQPMGEPTAVRASGSFALPDEVLAAARTGKQYVVIAVLEACETNEPEQGCIRRNSDVMNVEDGKFFSPTEYPVFLREKYGAKYPWLFEDGAVVRHIIEGEGD
jgi:hypothetical protein